MKNEPVVTYVSVGLVAAWLITGLSVWGLDLTDAQQSWLSGGAMTLSPLVAAVLARRKVEPVE